MVEGRHLLFQRLRDRRFHLLGRGAGIGREEHDVREAHVRQKIRGHFADGNVAEHQNEQDDDQNGKRFFDAEFRKHDGSPITGTYFPV